MGMVLKKKSGVEDERKRTAWRKLVILLLPILLFFCRWEEKKNLISVTLYTISNLGELSLSTRT